AGRAPAGAGRPAPAPFVVRDQARDGDCLFRCFSDQLYGTPEHHGLVRDRCSTYVACEQERFRQLCAGPFEELLARIRREGEWGDVLEIEALSAMYDRRIEIYAPGSQEPMRTFRQECGPPSREPVRLQYEGLSHYSSLARRGGAAFAPLLRGPPGEAEDDAIRRSRQRREAARSGRGADRAQADRADGDDGPVGLGLRNALRLFLINHGRLREQELRLEGEALADLPRFVAMASKVVATRAAIAVARGGALIEQCRHEDGALDPDVVLCFLVEAGAVDQTVWRLVRQQAQSTLSRDAAPPPPLALVPLPAPPLELAPPPAPPPGDDAIVAAEVGSVDVAALPRELVSLRGKRKLDAQTHRRQRRRIDSMNHEIVTATNALKVLPNKRQQEIGPSKMPNKLALHMCGKRKLSEYGQMSLGIRRNLSNISTHHVGICLMQDISSATVSRAEVAAAASLVASSRSYFTRVKADWAGWKAHSPQATAAPLPLAPPSVDGGDASEVPPLPDPSAEIVALGELSALAPPQTRLGLTTIMFMSDATNSAIWQERKLHCLSLEVYSSTAAADDVHWCHSLSSGRTQWSDAFSHLHALADVLPVEGGTPEDTLGLIVKHLKGLGCPLWGPELDLGAHNATDLIALCNVTDAGSDQRGARKMLSAICGPLANVVYLDANCLEHQYHLVCKGGLDLIDEELKVAKKKWTYYTSLCKITNTWRDLAKAVYSTWKDRFGSKSVTEFAGRLPPKCVAGRWGSVFAVETMYAAAGPDLICPVLEQVITRKDPDAAAPQVGPAPLADAGKVADELIGLAADETKAHKAKVGRWRRDVLTLCSKEERLFWTLMSVSRRVHTPGEHFSNCMLAYQTRDAGSISKTSGPNPHSGVGGAICALVQGKAESIYLEYDAMVGDPWWVTLISSAGLVADDAAFIKRIIPALVAYHAGGFYRRIVEPLK
ncbi:unnamed protein product, partial [Prorocentrum cordatum]